MSSQPRMSLPVRLPVTIAVAAMLAVACGQEPKPTSPTRSTPAIETTAEKCAELQEDFDAAIEQYRAGPGDDRTLQERFEFEEEMLDVLDYIDGQMKALDCPQWHERNDP